MEGFTGGGTLLVFLPGERREKQQRFSSGGDVVINSVTRQHKVPLAKAALQEQMEIGQSSSWGNGLVAATLPAHSAVAAGKVRQNVSRALN